VTGRAPIRARGPPARPCSAIRCAQPAALRWHAAGLHLGGNESCPDVFQPFGGFADGISLQDGYVGLPDVPGVGFEAKAALYEVMRQLA